VHRNELVKAEAILRDTAKKLGARREDRRQDLQSIHRRRRHALARGCRQQNVQSAGDMSINIQMITTSEIKFPSLSTRNTWSLLCAHCTRRLNWTCHGTVKADKKQAKKRTAALGRSLHILDQGEVAI